MPDNGVTVRSVESGMFCVSIWTVFLRSDGFKTNQKRGPVIELREVVLNLMIKIL